MALLFNEEEAVNLGEKIPVISTNIIYGMPIFYSKRVFHLSRMFDL